ncbi:MAG: hypothetical protein M1829_002581 [Trizodia sp. TS-e1964]|nr:MAG: hypothetical protein M1829_002581 [Trizodia sp. TS-e1964]
MSGATDAGYFFQTETSLKDSERRALKSKNTAGKPISLSSKILTLQRHPDDEGQIYAGLSEGCVRCVRLDTGATGATYRVPTTLAAPITCLALGPGLVFGGCWDKNIWSWDSTTRDVKHKFVGHSDFVKAIVTFRIGERTLLASGAADGNIILWNALNGERLCTLKGHVRGVQSLAVDPAAREDEDEVSLFSGSSDREIRRWKVRVSGEGQVVGGEEGGGAEIVQHETSIYQILFDDDGDLWTASADGAAKCLSRGQGFVADTQLMHPDFVKAVALDERGGWVITACRDEEIRVWERGTGTLYHTFTGHFGEVTSLALLKDGRLVSAGLDCTLRVWPMDHRGLRRAKEEADNAAAGAARGGEEGMAGVGPGPGPGLLTDEEERELAEIMQAD